MKLLIFTQKLDSSDSILGFFCGWVKEFAKISESVTVICLQKGNFDLPKNVTVISLGKERRVSWFGYVKNFYKYLFLIRGSYDRVFVHMNQEYVLLGGLYWKLKDIPVYLWRNHPYGNVLTRIAVGFSTKVFCTTPNSFTAKFKKTIIMPVGINTDIYKVVDGVTRKKYSVCIVSRISPVKNIDLALVAVNNLIASGVQVSLTIVGSPPDRDRSYYASLEKYVDEHKLSTSVSFVNEVPSFEVPKIYSGYEIALNLTNSFDKTIAESAACGAIPLVSNLALGEFLPDICITKQNPEAIAASIQRLFEPKEQVAIQEKLRTFVQLQSLSMLMQKLNSAMK